MIPKRPSQPNETLDLAALKKRHDELQKKKTVAETQLEAAEKELRKLKKEALEAYGTDDPAALEAKLRERKEENQQKLTAYQQALGKIESDLAAVEERYDESKTQEMP